VAAAGDPEQFWDGIAAYLGNEIDARILRWRYETPTPSYAVIRDRLHALGSDEIPSGEPGADAVKYRHRRALETLKSVCRSALKNDGDSASDSRWGRSPPLPG
jgi:hypothetical protein